MSKVEDKVKDSGGKPKKDEQVEYLQARPYKVEQASEQNYSQSRPQSRSQKNVATTILFTQKQTHKSKLLAYLIIFLMTALVATTLIFGFLIMLFVIAVLLPIWLVLRVIRGGKTGNLYR